MGCDLVLRTLAAGGPEGQKLADIITELVGKAAECGELEIATYARSIGRTLSDAELEAMPEGQAAAVRDQLVRVKRFPAIWIDRLDKAVETGSLARLSAERIVEALLSGPR